jgi:phytol kinase
VTGTVDLAPVAGIAVAGTAFATLMAALWLLGPTVTPERRRKLFHVGAGLIAVSLPWLIATRWGAVILVTATTAALLAVRAVPSLRASVGAALHSVRRRSLGEFYFAAAVLALFLLAPHGGPQYQIPVLILTIADTMAAFVGLGYGQHHLVRWASAKTVEGSMACCLATVAVTTTVLLLAGHAILSAISIAAVGAIAVTTAEAIGVAGSDNLLVPAAAYLVLDNLLAGQVVPTLITAVAVAATAWLVIELLSPAPSLPRRPPADTDSFFRESS